MLYRQRQRGAALLALAMFLAIATISYVLSDLNLRTRGSVARDRIMAERLKEARAALIGFAASHPTTPGRLPYPDRSADGKWDGIADCWNGTGSAIGAGLVLGRLPNIGAVTDVAAGEPNTGCRGETDWRLDVDSGAQRGQGLWYAVSRNVLYRSQSEDSPALNWTLLDEGAPYPWLTVRDAKGAVISDAVVAVVIAPGAMVEGQNRLWKENAPPDSKEYLDSVRVGTHRVANFDADSCPDDHSPCSDASGEDFIIAGRTDTFNDRLVFITASDLLRAVERRVVGDVAIALDQYRNRFGAYPWLSPYRAPAMAGDDGFPLSGWADKGSNANVLIDKGADFTARGRAGVSTGDIVEIVTDGSSGVVHSVDSATRLTLSRLSGGKTNTVAPDSGYNIRPRFNGVVTVREGQLPFLEPDYDPDTAGEQAETVAYSSGFTVDWKRRSDVVLAEANLSFPQGGDMTRLVAPEEGGLPATAVYDDLERDKVVAKARHAVWGLADDVTVGSAVSANGNGVCRWTGNTGQARCRGTSGDLRAGYGFTLTDTRSVPYAVHTFEVYRVYHFVLSVDGIGRTETTGNAKRRSVSYPSPGNPAGGPAFIIRVDEYLDSNLVYGTDYLLHSMTYSEPHGTAMEIEVSGIFHDLIVGDDFPRYIKDNDWHRYLYVALSHGSTEKPPSIVGTAGVGSRGDTLRDTSTDFAGNYVNAGDFVRNLTGDWQGFVTAVGSSSVITTGDETRTAFIGKADAGSSGAVLIDPRANFVALGVSIDDTVVNTTDDSDATIVTVVDGNTLSLSGLTGGMTNTFAAFDSYEITRKKVTTMVWSPGDSYQIWRWHCKTARRNDVGNPEPACLNLRRRELSNPGRVGARTDVRALVIAAGPESAGQDRQSTNACGTAPKAICDYFEDTNASVGDGAFLEDAASGLFNDEIRTVSTVF